MRIKRLMMIIVLILIGLVLLTAAEINRSTYSLTVSNYEIASEKLSNSFRLLQLSDIHSAVFGEQNKKLVDKVNMEHPDLILITGDLVNSKTAGEEEIQETEELIRNLTQIAPVYIAYGNQEFELESRLGCDMKAVYQAAGAKVLEYEYADVQVNGQNLRLGGIYGYCLRENIAWETGREAESDYLKAFLDTDRYTILMSHIPVSWIQSKSFEDWKVDTVYGGHLHGGQVRIPFIGGVYAPDMGWFPGSVSGLYEFKNEDSEQDSNYLILSRGLGNTEHIPRFNNTPEIIVVDYAAKEN